MDLHDPQCSLKMHLGSLWPCQLKRDCFSRSIFAFLYQDGTWCLWHLLQFSAILYRLHASSLFKCTMWQHTRLWRPLSKCNSALSLPVSVQVMWAPSLLSLRRFLSDSLSTIGLSLPWANMAPTTILLIFYAIFGYVATLEIVSLSF